MAARSFELWFDFSCPYAYLASRVASRLGVTVDWRPMLLGGVFRGIGAGDGPMATISPAKAAHNLRDMHRWADQFGVPFAMPPAHPMRTVRALRTLLGLPRADWPRAIAALYTAYWEHGRDLTSDAVIASSLVGAGLAPDAAAAALAGADGKKDELIARTQEAIDLGIFGAPAWVIRGVRPEPILVWGQDRLPWLEAIAAGWDPEAGPPPPRVAPAIVRRDGALPLDMYFDISSPFAYLGLTQVPRLAARAASVRLVPILLGALFREIGQANVPLLVMPPSKQRYVSREMARWGRWWNVPFTGPKKFPQRTVAAQRLVILAGEHGHERALALATALGRGMWAEGRDLEDDATLRAILVEQGLPPDLVERTQEPAVKAQLAMNTAEAQTRGAFGVPSFVVGDRFLVWGQDRLELVEKLLDGWVPPMERDAPVLPR